MVGIFYNENRAAASRGRTSDVKSEYREFKDLAHFVAWLADSGTFWCDAFNEDDIDYTDVNDIQSLIDSGDIDMESIMDSLENADISGGFPIIFSVEIDGTTYKTDWDPEDFEDDFEDEEDY